MQELFRVHEIRIDDVKQGGGVSPVVPFINPIPNNQKRPAKKDEEDTLEEEADPWLYVIQLGEEEEE